MCALRVQVLNTSRATFDKNIRIDFRDNRRLTLAKHLFRTVVRYLFFTNIFESTKIVEISLGRLKFYPTIVRVHRIVVADERSIKNDFIVSRKKLHRPILPGSSRPGLRVRSPRVAGEVFSRGRSRQVSAGPS